MTKFFYAKLAVSNIKKNRSTYIPFILTCIMTIATYYIMKSLSVNPGIEQMVGGATIDYTMSFGSWVVALFAVIFLFYTNSFLVKRRKKEFGVFHILGMEKRHLSRVLAWETLYVMLISFAAGFAIGIALDKAMFLLIGKIIGAEIVLGFFISPEVIAQTCMLFAVIFVLILANAVFQIRLSNPIDLLRAGNAGEKEPKTKWLLALLGIICIGIGYYLSITTENPVASIFSFFIAVVLVILGTYMLFTAGSIVFLKILRKNKNYYYKIRHFTSVSGMIYRMKQNAVGLANICILSTMVLVMVSSTTCLMVGMNDVLNTRHPHDFSVYVQSQDEETFQKLQELQKEKKLTVTYEQQYRYLQFSAFRQGDTFLIGRDMDGVSLISEIHALLFVPLSDYNAVMGTHKTLNDGEILLYSCRQPYDKPVMKLFGKEYRIVQKLDKFINNGSMAAQLTNYLGIVVPDLEVLEQIYNEQNDINGEIASDIRKLYEFDSSASPDEQITFYEDMLKMYDKQNTRPYIEAKEESRTGFISLYGGLFFIGIFLGVLFIMAAVLIIYYKQISEGYDDKERFAIMQNVGMSHMEVKQAIRSQVLTVFFLPLVAAGIHLAAAFPLISKLLALLNFVNVKLFIICTIVCFCVFTVMYVLIYLITARTYYRIVSK